MFGLVALVVAFGLVFSVVAFSPAKKTATLKYRYNGPDEAGLHTPGNWSDVSAQPNPEGCEPGEEIPCLIQFETPEYDDLQDFLDQNPTLQDMIDSETVQSYKNEVIEP